MTSSPLAKKMTSSSSPITIDLILEILSRLPSKSVKRFHCVSKLWASKLGSSYFKDLFLTRSLAKPHLLFATVQDNVWRFFSLPQLQNPYEKVTAAKFPPNDMRIHNHKDQHYFSHGYASGLIYFYGASYDEKPVICNPNTGGYVALPYLKRYRKAYSFFGFEPIDKQFKVLFMGYPSSPDYNKHQILTVGTRDRMRWRRIKCSLRHEIKSQGLCINGVLYYLGDTSDWSHMNKSQDVKSDYVIVCFHLRSEKFRFIYVDRFCSLINYKGKLAMVYFKDDADSEDDVEDCVDYNVDGDAINELNVWVLEDVKKQEWSKYAYTLRDDKFFRPQVSVAGMTASGEIVFSMRKYTSKHPFYVFYFNPERNTLRRVEIQGFGEAFCSVYTFVDHVEDLNVNDSELLKSLHAPSVKRGKSKLYYS